MNMFDALYSTFSRNQELAANIKSPNSRDSGEIKIAIVGFSHNCPTETWGVDEFDFTHRNLATLHDLSEKERLFYALGTGYLLGLVRSDRITQSDFKVALSQLPGFILLKGGNF